MLQKVFSRVRLCVSHSQTLRQPFAISRRTISDALRASLEKSIQSNDVLVFMKGTKEAPQCGFSRAVMQILSIQGLDKFATVNVLADEQVRMAIKEYTSWPTIPQVFIKGEFVGGCDIMINMHQSGELEKLLTEKGLLQKETS